MLLLSINRRRCILAMLFLCFFIPQTNAQVSWSINPETTSNYNGYGVSCANSCDGTALVQITGNNTSPQFLWETGATTASINGLCAGRYRVTVTDPTGHAIIDSVTLTSPAPMQPIAAVYSDYHGQDIRCTYSTDGEAIAGATGGIAPYTYQWATTPAQQTQIAVGLAAGHYPITITDANNCTATTTVTLQAPPLLRLSIDSVHPINCVQSQSGGINASVSGGTPSYQFTLNTNQASNWNGDFHGLAANMHQLTVSDTNGCQQSQFVLVEDADSLEVTIEALATIACHGDNDAVLLAKISGRDTTVIDYQWNNGISTNLLTHASATDYQVTVTDNGGCTATDSITVMEPAPIDADVTTTGVSCEGENDGSITIDSTYGGTGPYLYSFIECGPFNNTSNWNNLPDGEYTIHIQDANGCIQTITDIMVDPPIDYNLIAHQSQVIDVGQTVELSGSVSYSDVDSSLAAWATYDADSGRLVTLIQGSEALTGYTPDTFYDDKQFILYLNNVCNDSAMVHIEVQYDTDIYIPNAFTPNGNNVNDIFTVFGSPKVAEIKTLQVYDRWGELVFFKENFPPNSIAWDGTFRGQALGMGVFVYYTEIMMNDGQRIIKHGDVSLLR